MNQRKLTSTELKALLAEVGEILHARGLHSILHVVGGAAMALTLDARRLTRDVDASTNYSVDFRDAVATVARRHNLAPDWINSGGAAFVSDKPLGEPVELDMPGMQVVSASPEHLLAMKLRRGEARDYDDLRTLIRHLRLATPEQVVELVEAQFDESNMFPMTTEEYLIEARDAIEYAYADD